jgi:hypothetical protein
LVAKIAQLNDDIRFCFLIFFPTSFSVAFGVRFVFFASYYQHEGSHYCFVDASYEFSLKKPNLDFELS